MFDKIIELLTGFFEYIKFWWVVEQYNRAVLLRFGKFVKVLNPGYHWKIPFSDIAIEHTVVPTTMRLNNQSLYTKDDTSISTQAIIKYQVSDVKTLLLEVYDPVDAIADMTQAIIKRIIMDRTWQECLATDLDNEITKKAKTEAKKWGIEIISVILVEFTKAKSFRIISNSSVLSAD